MGPCGAIFTVWVRWLKRGNVLEVQGGLRGYIEREVCIRDDNGSLITTNVWGST